MRKNRVFVGPGNIAGHAMYVTKSLRLAGINAKSFSYKTHPFGYPCDFDNILFNNPFPGLKKRNLIQKLVINKYTLRTLWSVQKVLLFGYALIWYDTFFFISHETIFNNNKDLWLLKFFKKKIAILFMGCPERNPGDIINQSDGGFCSFCKDEAKQNHLNCFNGNKKREKIEYISKYADVIFSHRDTASFVLDISKIRPFYCLTDLTINGEEFLNKYKRTEDIIISHLPSNNLLKGTDSVLIAINELKKKDYQFHFFSERLNHSEVDDLLKQTHILIDQFSVGHGLLGAEGMAHGCIVICRIAKWFKEDFPELPLVSCEPEELTDVLIDLISDPEKMLSIARKSLEYYQKFHTPEVVGNYYKKTLDLN